MATRQQTFGALVRQLNELNNHPEWEGSDEQYERVQRRLAIYVWQNANRITIASDKKKAKQ